MSVRRVHLPRERIAGDRALLTPEARHYLVDVLRLAAGAEVEVFDGAGGAYDGRLDASGEALHLGPRRDVGRAAAPVWLLLALAKGEKVDLVVQKATELGVAAIAPFAAERSVVKLEPGRAEERVRRWRRIAEEAARQCGRADVPELHAPVPLAAALAAVPAGFARVLFHPGGVPVSALDVPGASGHVAIVGPEGGLTDAEVLLCEGAGAVRASLGPRILRAETAAIVAVALLQARFGDLAA